MSEIFPFSPANGSIPLKHFLLALQPQSRADRASAERVGQHLPSLSRTKLGSCRSAAGMCRTFIQRSAFQRRNSISSAARCSVRTTAVVPSYSSSRSIHDQSLLAEVFRHGRARIRRGMLNVRPVHVAAREFEVGFDRLARVVGIADDQAADHVHLVAVQVVDSLQRGIAGRFGRSRAQCFSRYARRNSRSPSRMFSMPRKT